MNLSNRPQQITQEELQNRMARFAERGAPAPMRAQLDLILKTQQESVTRAEFAELSKELQARLLRLEHLLMREAPAQSTVDP